MATQIPTWKKVILGSVIAVIVLPVSCFTCNLVSAVILVFVGGDFPPSIFIVNHSGQGLTVEVGDKVEPLPQNLRTEITFSPSRFHNTKLIIRTSKGETWRYPSFYGGAMNGQRFFQVEPDGSLFVLPSDRDETLQELAQQPIGFPLKPDK
jgi:hypothetical protein